MIYISVPRAAIHTLVNACDHGNREQRGCHGCHRRDEARRQLQAYLRATPPNPVPEPECEAGPPLTKYQRAYRARQRRLNDGPV